MPLVFSVILSSQVLTVFSVILSIHQNLSSLHRSVAGGGGVAGRMRCRYGMWCGCRGWRCGAVAGGGGGDVVRLPGVEQDGCILDVGVVSRLHTRSFKMDHSSGE